jgi:hypothetical protein
MSGIMEETRRKTRSSLHHHLLRPHHLLRLQIAAAAWIRESSIPFFISKKYLRRAS